MGDDIIHAESPEAGLSQLIKKKESIFTSAEVTYLNEFKRRIHSEAKDPTNITIVIYSGKDRHFDIKIGNGKERYVIDLSDCTHQSQTGSRRIKLSITQEGKNQSKIGFFHHVIVGGLGAAGVGGFYLALAANPVTGPLLLATAGGAALGSAVSYLGGNRGQNKAINLECEPDDLEKVSNVIRKAGVATPIEGQK